MKKLSLLLVIFSLFNIGPVFAHTDNSMISAASTPMPPAVVPVKSICVYEWCDAKWPPAAGQDRTIGKDNCGNTCTKIAKPLETASIAPPAAAKPVVVAEPSKEAIAKPAKDLLGKTGNVEGITVTLSQSMEGKPVLECSCPAGEGITQYDRWKQAGRLKQKLHDGGRGR